MPNPRISPYTTPMASFPKGTNLFHGTMSCGCFEVPDGPAWFAFDTEEASHWIRSSKWLLTEREAGARRIYQFELIDEIVIPDIRRWIDFKTYRGMLAEGIESPGMKTLATRVERFGHQGWLKEREIMLVNPLAHLRLITEGYLA